MGIDDKAGIRLIVRHLTTLGHRNLLYLYETFDATMGFSSHNRVTGFLEACSELDGVTGQTMDMQAGDDPVDAALTALLARDDAPTACASIRIRWRFRCSSACANAAWRFRPTCPSPDSTTARSRARWG